MDPSRGPPLCQVLPWFGLAQYEAQIYTLGAYFLNDLVYVTDYDLRGVGMSLVEARVLLSSLSAGWFDWGTSSAAASVDTNMMYKINFRAQEKEVEAIDSLNSCLALAYSSCAQMSIMSIEHALQRLQECLEYTRNAMLAFVSTSRGRASCRDGALRKAFDKALKSVRDCLVWRVQLSVPWGNREAFLAELERAYGGTVNQEMLAQFLHSHSKTICEEFPSAFLSNCKMRRRAPRPPKAAKRAIEAARDEASSSMAEKHIGEPWPTFQQEGISEDLQGSYAPGLEICQIGSEASFATGGKLHGRKKVISQKTIVHSSCARTSFSLPSDTDIAPDLDHDYPHLVESLNSLLDERGILVLSELHKILVWLDNGRGGQDHIRPGAMSLVSGLLGIPDVTFAIVSSMSYWNLLPATRKFLEEAFPNTTWRVEECFDGEWADYKTGLTFSISGGKLYCRESENLLQIEYEGIDRCLAKEPYANRTWHGYLNPDGFLEWDIDGVKSDWFRAGRQAPPCLVCQDHRGLQIFVFDKEAVTEVMCEKEERGQRKTVAQDFNDGDEKSKNGQWVWRRKELNSAWSALSESCCGVFDATNTILLDEAASLSSHPGNVIEVPQWRHGEDARTMRDILGLIEKVVAERPDNIADCLNSAWMNYDGTTETVSDPVISKNEWSKFETLGNDQVSSSASFSSKRQNLIGLADDEQCWMSSSVPAGVR
jgi:hypothetical protein